MCCVCRQSVCLPGGASEPLHEQASRQGKTDKHTSQRAAEHARYQPRASETQRVKRQTAKQSNDRASSSEKKQASKTSVSLRLRVIAATAVAHSASFFFCFLLLGTCVLDSRSSWA